MNIKPIRGTVSGLTQEVWMAESRGLVDFLNTNLNRFGITILASRLYWHRPQALQLRKVTLVIWSRGNFRAPKSYRGHTSLNLILTVNPFFILHSPTIRSTERFKTGVSDFYAGSSSYQPSTHSPLPRQAPPAASPQHKNGHHGKI